MFENMERVKKSLEKEALESQKKRNRINEEAIKSILNTILKDNKKEIEEGYIRHPISGINITCDFNEKIEELDYVERKVNEKLQGKGIRVKLEEREWESSIYLSYLRYINISIRYVKGEVESIMLNKSTKLNFLHKLKSLFCK